jgi:hypothetical protein
MFIGKKYCGYYAKIDNSVACVPILEVKEQRFLFILLVAGLFRTVVYLIYTVCGGRRKGWQMPE